MSVPRPNFSLRIDVFHHDATSEDVVSALKTLGEEMAKSFAKLMEEVRNATQEIKDHRTAADAAEVEEDRLAAERDATNDAKIAELQAKIDAGNLSETQEAEAVAAIAELRAAAGLPEPTPDGPVIEPTEPETPAEPTPDGPVIEG